MREVREVPCSIVDAESLMRTAAAGGGAEPIGARIVECPSANPRCEARRAFRIRRLCPRAALPGQSSGGRGRRRARRLLTAAMVLSCSGWAIYRPRRPASATYLTPVVELSERRAARQLRCAMQAVAGMRTDEMLAIAACLASLRPTTTADQTRTRPLKIAANSVSVQRHITLRIADRQNRGSAMRPGSNPRLHEICLRGLKVPVASSVVRMRKNTGRA